MLVSIITPAYNPGELLLETYDSLAKQTFQNFEWIIVDDNSDNDNKKLIQGIEKIASFPVRIIRNEINLRQAKSKNIGLTEAKGKYIKFLDADDLLDKKHLENQYYLIESKNSKNIAVFSPTINFVGSIENSNINDSYKSVPLDNIRQLEQFLVYPFFHHCGVLFRKDAVEHINGFDENLLTDEDGDFILRLMLNGVLFFPEERSAYYYRKHDFNVRVSANDSDEKWLARMKVCLKIEKKLNGKYAQLKEPLAQRLDVIGLSCLDYSEDLSQEFFMNAERIYPNYAIPGNMLPKIIRTLFGNKGYYRIKKLLGKR
jgi:glycosyltransferase involved in cell wall biosynthesis